MKRTLYIVPIEPLEERYSAQWLRWTKSYVSNFIKSQKEYHGNEVVAKYINPKSYEEIQHGAFLDVFGTHMHKCKQLMLLLAEIQKRVKANDKMEDTVIWVHDMWFPGIEQLAYVRNALNLKFKIYGMIHAGVHDPHDFITRRGMTFWATDLQKSWFRIFDGIFCATNFHNFLIKNQFNGFWEHGMAPIHVTGFPIVPNQEADSLKPWNERDDIVVFPHRIDEEKQPELCVFLYEALQQFPETKGYRVLLTKKECETKEEYYALLKRAKFSVSFAKQETWGIAMQESVFAGAVPIVPGNLSYTEMYNSVFTYCPIDSVMGAVRCIISILHKDKDLVSELLLRDRINLEKQGRDAFSNMFGIMFKELYQC